MDPKLFADKWRGKLVREWRSFWDSDTGASWKSLMRASVDLENTEIKGLIGWLETGWEERESLDLHVVREWLSCMTGACLPYVQL